MTIFKKNKLIFAVSLAVGAVSPISALAADACAGINEYPNWPQLDWAGNPSHANAGDKMQYQGKAYTANWYSSSIPGSDGSWKFDFDCNGTTDPGTGTGPGTGTSNASLLIRKDPVNLKVAGWPSTLAMGTFTNNSATLNGALASANVDSVFSVVTNAADALATLKQARDVEKANGGEAIVPVAAVSTASGLGDTDILTYANLVAHYQNLIQIAAQVQVFKDAAHASPGSIVLNEDLLATWQANKDTTFATAFGTDTALTEVQVKRALREAITNVSALTVTDAAGTSQSISSLYNLSAIDTAAANLADNVKGWVASQNFVMEQFAKDVSYGWSLSVSNPGTTSWVHKDYAGLRSTWNAASQSVVSFVNWTGAYADAAAKPDFLVFNQSGNNGLSTAGRAEHAFGPIAWDNYLVYVKQVTDSIDVPAMLYKLPGAHLATTSQSGNYDAATQAGTAASFFMGDKSLGKSSANLRSDVASIALDSATYGVSSVASLVEQESHDWGVSQLRRAAHSNVFSILWGSDSATPVVSATANTDWLKGKVAAYQANPIPLYYVSESLVATPLTSVAALNADLEGAETVMNNEAFLYELPGNKWAPSTIYKWKDFLKALNSMHNVGVAGNQFWLIDPNADIETNKKYAKVAIAAFLSQSMQETIRYNACDENNWAEIKYGAPANHPNSASCGQLDQKYADYGYNPVTGQDHPYSCPRNNKLELSANTHASWYGAPAPIFVAPDAVLKEEGKMAANAAGRWDINGEHCMTSPQTIDENKQVWERSKCEIYAGQKAGAFLWDGSSKQSIEGCGWWGRGVIQTTGRQNFGTLNHFIGRSHVDPETVGQTIEGTLVEAAPANPLYADLDLCSNPQLICSTEENTEIKWIAGLFFWMTSVQNYSDVGGPYAAWNYHDELKAYVDGGMVGTKFVDAVSGIVNRGCPDDACPVSGKVHAIAERRANFNLVLQKLGLNPQ